MINGVLGVLLIIYYRVKATDIFYLKLNTNAANN